MITRGFTFIELLVVIAITILLSSLGLAAYNQFNNRQIVKRNGAAITDLLRLAQIKALTGEKPSTGACSSETLWGYRVKVSGQQFILEAVCGTTGVDVGKTYTLTSDVTVSSGSEVMFKVLAQGAAPQTFCFTGYDLNYRVRTLGSGEVVEDGFVESCN
mgnify:CR=1 FL=1